MSKLLTFSPRNNTSAINAVAVAQHSDPMKNHAMVLGRELLLEQLREKYEVLVLGFALSVCVNIGGIIYFLIEIAKQ
jgi:hypothetical protein